MAKVLSTAIEHQIIDPDLESSYGKWEKEKKVRKLDKFKYDWFSVWKSGKKMFSNTGAGRKYKI